MRDSPPLLSEHGIGVGYKTLFGNYNFSWYNCPWAEICLTLQPFATFYICRNGPPWSCMALTTSGTYLATRLTCRWSSVTPSAGLAFDETLVFLRAMLH
jgi:hypothetical protein